METVAKAQKIIATNHYMTLATSTNDGTPWITPVYFAYDKDYIFYWYSGRDTKHSQLIHNNHQVSAVIFNSQASAEEAGGVYLEGQATEVAPDEVIHALTIYCDRAFAYDKNEQSAMLSAPQDFLGNSQLRLYKFIPEKVYLSGEAEKWNGKWLDTRTEITLR